MSTGKLIFTIETHLLLNALKSTKKLCGIRGDNDKLRLMAELIVTKNKVTVCAPGVQLPIKAETGKTKGMVRLPLMLLYHIVKDNRQTEIQFVIQNGALTHNANTTRNATITVSKSIENSFPAGQTLPEQKVKIKGPPQTKETAKNQGKLFIAPTKPKSKLGDRSIINTRVFAMFAEIIKGLYHASGKGVPDNAKSISIKVDDGNLIRIILKPNYRLEKVTEGKTEVVFNETGDYSLLHREDMESIVRDLTDLKNKVSEAAKKTGNLSWD